MLVTLVDKLDIRLDNYPFKKEHFCGMLVLDEYETTIVYNSNHSSERRNFTIAHELGHYLLHRNKQIVDRAENMLDNSINEFEMQANSFAAQLLLPESVVNLMIGYRYSFFRIAKSTHTSYDCLKWRLVSYLMRNFSIGRKDSIDIVEAYRQDSDRKLHADSVFFKIIFPGGRKYELINGELVEFSPITNKVIEVIPINRKRVDYLESFGLI
ncbi:ImmA/IrrE family metallo-endopeptidase [Brevibacillus formosus]